jgi:hypothetical protein
MRSFGKEFKSAQARVSKFAGFLRGALPGMAGMLGIGALVGSAKGLGEDAAKWRDWSRRTKITTEELQRLEYAAKQTGTTMEVLANAYERLQKSQYDAARGSKEMVDAFRALGIDPAGLTPQQLWTKTTTALQGSSQQAALSRTLMGRGGSELLQPLNQNLAALMAEAPVIEGAAVEKMATSMDQLTLAMTQMRVDMAPTLQSILKILETLAAFPGWVGKIASQAGTASVEGISMQHQPGNWGAWPQAMVDEQRRTNRLLEAEE